MNRYKLYVVLKKLDRELAEAKRVAGCNVDGIRPIDVIKNEINEIEKLLVSVNRKRMRI